VSRGTKLEKENIIACTTGDSSVIVLSESGNIYCWGSGFSDTFINQFQ